MGHHQRSLDMTDEEEYESPGNHANTGEVTFCEVVSSSSAKSEMETMDTLGDDRDETKRQSRNLSEKKRRDQFNKLINELCSMVSGQSRKMDKSTVLKATITFLRSHNELSAQSQLQESQEDWKPSFLPNEEFTHLMMESLDGLIIVLSCTGLILYLSESVTSLLGHLSSDLINRPVFDYVAEDERANLHNLLSRPVEDKVKNQNVSLQLSFKLGGFGVNEDNNKYQLVRFIGYFKRWMPGKCGNETSSEESEGKHTDLNESSLSNYIFIATGRLIDADLLREISVVADTTKNQFCSRHSLEWKFLFLDHRAPPIIGYLPFEVLGTSGYDYYHAEDLEKIASCHEALMQKGEGTSCFYRFLTKGQQWIWLQTRFYITYHQWNSKPEFIMCTHRVVSYADVMKSMRGEIVKETKFSTTRTGPSIMKQPRLEYKRMGSKSLRQRSKSVPQRLNTSVSMSHHPASQHPLHDQASVPSPAISTCAAMPFVVSPVTASQSGTEPESIVLSSGRCQPLILSSPQSDLREQLLMKHAELQRHISEQQEELKRVSEQLLIAQVGFIRSHEDPNIPSSVPEPSVDNTKHPKRE